MQKYPNNNQIYFTPLQAHPKYETEIKGLLQNLQNQKYSTHQIIQVLKTFNQKYCWRRKQANSFKSKIHNPYQALVKLYQKDLPQLCKFFAAALLRIQPQPIPLVMGGKKTKVSYKKQQIIYMMLLMFFSLTPKQYCDGREYLQNKFNYLNNFLVVLSHSQFKTQCIVQYLKFSVKQLLTNINNEEIFTICRNVSNETDIQKVIRKKQEKKMTKLNLVQNNRSIEQFNGEIKVDFANRFIGGGCLTNGCVQQQIMFTVHPQLFVTTLLCQKMQDNEALAFMGFKRYFNYKGYSNTTEFDGFANVKYDLTQDCQTREFITAVDAIKFNKGGREQFQKKLIDRQILKAYVGFAALSVSGAIVSGGWGCGVYNGDIQIKLIIQWIAASLAERQLIICPFGKKKILEEHNFLQFIKDKKIVDAYKILLQLSSYKLQGECAKLSLYSIALQKL